MPVGGEKGACFYVWYLKVSENDFFFCQFSNSIPALCAPRLLQSHLTCVPSSGFVPPPLFCVCSRRRPALRWRALIVALQPPWHFLVSQNPLWKSNVNASGTPCRIIRQFYTRAARAEEKGCWMFNTCTHTQMKFPPRAARRCPAVIYSSLLIALMVFPVSWVFLLARGYTLTLHPSSLGLR